MGENAKPTSDERVEKGGETVEESVLEKSLDALQDIVNQSGTAKRQELAKKAGENTLTKSEAAELVRLISGEAFDKATSESIAKSLDPSGSETFQKSIDVTPYLDEFHTKLSGAMVSLAERLEKSDAAHEEQITVLAKGLLDIGAAVVSIDRKLSAVKARDPNLPTRAPKAVGAGATKPIEKSLGGQTEEPVSKAEIADTIEEMLQKSMSNDHEKKGLSLHSGVDLMVEGAQFEQFGTVSEAFRPELMSAVRERRARRA